MIRSSATTWQFTSLGVITLTLVAGCALPGLGSKKHEDLLKSLAADEQETGFSPPPELIREPSPYPTAVPPGSVPATTAKVEQAPQQSPAQTAYPSPQQTIAASIPPSGQPPIQQPQAMVAPQAYQAPRQQTSSTPRETYLPVSPPSPTETAVQATLNSSALHWPVNQPLGSLNTLTQPALVQTTVSAVVPSSTTSARSSASSEVALVSHQPENVKPQSPASDPTLASTSPGEAAASKTELEPLETLCQKHIAALEREIQQRLERKDETEVPALRQKLRLLQLIADRNDDAVDKVEQLPPAEREAFKQMMFALSTWLSPEEAKRASLRNAKILRSLQEVNNSLSAASKLDLSNLMFCEKVESFGWYTEFSRAEFTPKQQVILYVEVQNFAAEEKTASSFETELQGSYQIYDAAGNLVDERQLPLDREICRNYRRDYFLAYRIHLPGELTPGKYRLELNILDLKAKQDFKGRKQGEAMIEFAIKS
ncbi:hypothetical protein NA78x_001431 [Anatilimnocola sp. NA78]|uniref:hypothetical protein n=1 Tax=Anatilimnocola sp. NA78 TaxID=3415683 RepID=UPI003CE4C8B6